MKHRWGIEVATGGRDEDNQTGEENGNTGEDKKEKNTARKGK